MSKKKKRLDDDDDFFEEDWTEPTNTGSINSYTEYDRVGPGPSYQTTKIGFVTDDVAPTAAKPKRYKNARTRNPRA